MKIDEQERMIRTLEHSLRSSGQESERRLVELQKEHERKVQTLMREIQVEEGGRGGASDG